MPATLPLLVLFLFSVPALAAYKCTADGKTVYSDMPCRDGHATEIVAAPPPADAQTARQRQLRDKEQLQHIEAERRKHEAIAEKQRQKERKADAARKKKCDDLALRVKWANEDVAHASMKSAKQAKLKARRLAEKQQLECAPG